MNCTAACGSIGQPGSQCSYICKMCGTKCEGKIAKSLSVSIGKNPFKCKCKYIIQSTQQSIHYDYDYNNCNNYNDRCVKRKIDPEFNEVF